MLLSVSEYELESSPLESSYKGAGLRFDKFCVIGEMPPEVVLPKAPFEGECILGVANPDPFCPVGLR